MAHSRLKIALIGCGGIAQAHWQGIQRIATRVDVPAVVDKNPEMANAMHAAVRAKKADAKDAKATRRVMRAK